jgi:regulator of replication initiation timing
MSDLKLKQLQYESETWKRILGFMMEENVHLKNRLSAVLRDRFDDRLLEEMENFHSRFIREDELISLLRHDMAELDNLLIREVFEDGMLKKKLVKRFKQLRNHIKKTELQFGRLKMQFISYLTENI